jgi:two-component system, OmpR family, response regulator RegX3
VLPERYEPQVSEREDPGKDQVKKFLYVPQTCEHDLMRILLVEDDIGIAKPLVEGLQRQGYEVTWVGSGREAIAEDNYDVVLLDLGLPDVDGEVVTAKIREVSEVPIIVVTARSDEIDRVSLLDLGADDYITKPFGFRELTARIRAVTRRASGGSASYDDTVEVGRLSIDHRTRIVTFDGEEISLTPKEYDLLDFLTSDRGAVLSRDEILRSVWDENWWGSTKTLDVHIASLRRKLGDPDIIRTVRGVGYQFVGSDQ